MEGAGTRRGAVTGEAFEAPASSAPPVGSNGVGATHAIDPRVAGVVNTGGGQEVRGLLEAIAMTVRGLIAAAAAAESGAPSSELEGGRRSRYCLPLKRRGRCCGCCCGRRCSRAAAESAGRRSGGTIGADFRGVHRAQMIEGKCSRRSGGTSGSSSR